MVHVYFHDDNDTPEDFTDAHYLRDTTLDELSKIGVIYRKVTTEDELNALAKERNYKNRDVVNLNLDTFGGDIEAYNNKMKTFYHEHYHEDEEIRYVVSGEGYFDVRDKSERWIRAKMVANDLLILPAGICHRFTLTSEKKQIKAVRLFKDEPKWEAINRDSGRETSARTEYLESIAV